MKKRVSGWGINVGEGSGGNLYIMPSPRTDYSQRGNAPWIMTKPRVKPVVDLGELLPSICPFRIEGLSLEDGAMSEANREAMQY